MRTAALLTLLLLAACASPRAACERDATRDVRVLDDLIAETERTLARGYGVEREPYRRMRVNFCYGGQWGDRNRVGLSFCTAPETAWRDRPVAVDLTAERARLRQLKASRHDLGRTALRKLEVCRARYPEG
ncbi:hypothetical protein RGUI_2027 [Rhodovulum sp. P5]|uniref:hypothetical protein n=1 Tax=Rhodovulum sp. P5 TaxID=1564506 RepID=UPI0009C1FD18|nr:hypothetical protein [Rhodovulum sp. P5]ARE40168.1 hypothetical protein RGUI_2027 [Rhodovulum sp. P5]